MVLQGCPNRCLVRFLTELVDPADLVSKTLGISDLSEKLVETRKHIVYPLVYRILKLVMILHVATTTVERFFSAMKIVKSRLRGRMGMNG